MEFNVTPLESVPPRPGIPSREMPSSLPLKVFMVWNAERPKEAIKGLEKQIGFAECGQFPKLIVKKYT
jgi:hypothetical protein